MPLRRRGTAVTRCETSKPAVGGQSDRAIARRTALTYYPQGQTGVRSQLHAAALLYAGGHRKGFRRGEKHDRAPAAYVMQPPVWSLLQATEELWRR